jgi:hypothetical protein
MIIALSAMRWIGVCVEAPLSISMIAATTIVTHILYQVVDCVAHAVRAHMNMPAKPLDPHTWIEALMLFYNHSVASVTLAPQHNAGSCCLTFLTEIMFNPQQALHTSASDTGLYINQPAPLFLPSDAAAEATTLHRPWYAAGGR